MMLSEGIDNQTLWFFFLLIDDKYTVPKSELASGDKFTKIFRAMVSACAWQNAAFLADDPGKHTWKWIC